MQKKVFLILRMLKIPFLATGMASGVSIFNQLKNIFKAYRETLLQETPFVMRYRYAQILGFLPWLSNPLISLHPYSFQSPPSPQNDRRLAVCECSRLP